jgi:hypothetical protein
MKKHSLLFTIVVTLALAMAGCNVPATTQGPQPGQLPQQPQSTFQPPQQPGQPGQPGQLSEQPTPPEKNVPTPGIQRSLFQHIKTVRITPDEHFLMGQGSDVLYIPATDRIVVILQTKVAQPTTMPTSEVCADKVIGYVEYTMDMQPTGKYGYLACGFADVHSLGIGNDVYIAKMSVPKAIGDPATSRHYWTVEKYNAVTWERQASVDVPLQSPTEADGGPDPSYINGQIVVTSQYTGGQECCGTHNNRFTRDLTPLETIYLQPPEVPGHSGEFSLLQQSNGDILLFATTHGKGDLQVLRFDKDWQFRDQRVLLPKGTYPTGSATDGHSTYVAYQAWTDPDGGLAGMNIHLAAFDDRWNLIQDVAVTDVQSLPGDLGFGDGASIALHGNRLYVSYFIVNPNPALRVLGETQMHTYVDVYELTQR